MQPTAQLAEFADRALHLGPRIADQFPRPDRIVVDLLFGHAEVETDRHQLLLHAVVEVPFDPSPLARHRIEDVGAL